MITILNEKIEWSAFPVFLIEIVRNLETEDPVTHHLNPSIAEIDYRDRCQCCATAYKNKQKLIEVKKYSSRLRYCNIDKIPTSLKSRSKI